MCVSVFIYTILPTFLACASTLASTARAGHKSKIPGILQQPLKVCICTATVTVAGLITPKQHVAAAWSSCGTVDSAVCPPCHQPDAKGPQLAEVRHRDSAFLASLLKDDKFAAIN